MYHITETKKKIICKIYSYNIVSQYSVEHASLNRKVVYLSVLLGATVNYLTIFAETVPS